MKRRSHIVMIVPRGEAVRNFLYSKTLPLLSKNDRVTILSVVKDERFLERFRPYADDILPLEHLEERRFIKILRLLTHEAHFRWLWSKVARNVQEMRDAKAVSKKDKVKRKFIKIGIKLLANTRILEMLTTLDQYLSWKFRTSNTFVDLFNSLKPDLVFNCSHIHGPAGELPAKIAKRMGIPLAGFVFSWDNLTSRSRIFVPYDYYIVWHEKMKRQLLDIYPRIDKNNVFITGTPQFDFHFDEKLWLSREKLCIKIGIDPERPFILYTTGIAKHFPEEHRTVKFVADQLNKMDIYPKPQLVVRTYVKGNSKEMIELSKNTISDVVFPKVLWEETWYTPMYEDLYIYTNLLRHCALGINAASTVSLELLMHDKPVINLGFDPPGSNVPHHWRWRRHIEFDHYEPVAKSGAVMVARSKNDLAEMISLALKNPENAGKNRKEYIKEMFGGKIDGKSGEKIAEILLNIAVNK